MGVEGLINTFSHACFIDVVCTHKHVLKYGEKVLVHARPAAVYSHMDDFESVSALEKFEFEVYHVIQMPVVPTPKLFQNVRTHIASVKQQPFFFARGPRRNNGAVDVENVVLVSRWFC